MAHVLQLGGRGRGRHGVVPQPPPGVRLHDDNAESPLRGPLDDEEQFPVLDQRRKQHRLRDGEALESGVL